MSKKQKTSTKPIEYNDFYYNIKIYKGEGWLVLRDSHGEELAWINLDEIRRNFTDF